MPHHHESVDSRCAKHVDRLHKDLESRPSVPSRLSSLLLSLISFIIYHEQYLIIDKDVDSRRADHVDVADVGRLDSKQ